MYVSFVFVTGSLPTHRIVGGYYAAQVGISESLKAASVLNRNFLAALLTLLESLRATLGSSDAIAVESASSAYVENFALRVFASADNEDRRSVATRKTAKNFLAAATFFEVLNVFEDRGPWETVGSLSIFLLPETLLTHIGVHSPRSHTERGKGTLRQVESCGHLQSPSGRPSANVCGW